MKILSCSASALRLITLGAFLVASSVAHSAQTDIPGVVNINEADGATLAAAIRGVGPKLGQAIVDYRTLHGPFQRVDDLTAVKGIGERLIEKSRGRLSVGSDAPSTAASGSADPERAGN